MTFSRWHQKLYASVYFKWGPPSMRQEHAGAQRGTDKGDNAAVIVKKSKLKDVC